MEIYHGADVGDTQNVEELQALIRNQSEIIQKHRDDNKNKLEKKSLKRFSRMTPDEDRTAICAPIVYYDSQFYGDDCDVCEDYQNYCKEYKDYVASVREEYFGFGGTVRCQSYYWFTDQFDYSPPPSIVRRRLEFEDAQDINTPNSLDSESIASVSEGEYDWMNNFSSSQTSSVSAEEPNYIDYDSDVTTDHPLW